MKWIIVWGLFSLFALFMYFTGKAIDREAGQLNQAEEKIRVKRVIDNRIREVVFTPTQIQEELYRLKMAEYYRKQRERFGLNEEGDGERK